MNSRNVTSPAEVTTLALSALDFWIKALGSRSTESNQSTCGVILAHGMVGPTPSSWNRRWNLTVWTFSVAKAPCEYQQHQEAQE